MRIALVVQRYGDEVVGGSETLARHYARLLQDRADVEVLTTCAVNHRTWANHYPVGITSLDGIRIRRFVNDFERGPYWEELYRLLLGPMDACTFSSSPRRREAHARRLAAWPRALQEETIRWQGPYSSALFDYLGKHAQAYDAFLFFTYLFPTSYYGMQCVAGQRVIFCPTLHDEPIAYLPVYRRSFQHASSIIFLTESERALAARLYRTSRPGEVVGMALERPLAVGPLPAGTPPRYVLYAGRIEGSKGTDTLFAHFCHFKRRFPSDLKLVLIGTAAGSIPSHPDLVFLGFVSEPVKFALLKHAQALLHPSPYESFSIVLLESFMMGTPALVNGENAVLMEHCHVSGAGTGYLALEEFCQKLRLLLADESERQEMGKQGQRYVTEKFSTESVGNKLWSAVVACGSVRKSAGEISPRDMGAQGDELLASAQRG